MMSKWGYMKEIAKVLTALIAVVALMVAIYYSGYNHAKSELQQPITLREVEDDE